MLIHMDVDDWPYSGVGEYEQQHRREHSQMQTSLYLLVGNHTFSLYQSNSSCPGRMSSWRCPGFFLIVVVK